MSRTNLKKYLAELLAAVLTFTAVPVFARAETDKDAVILYTNDVHCAIDDYSELAAYAAQLEAEGQEVVIVDAGDAIQGEVIGTLTQGEAIIDLMNTVGYDYAVPGNHEFDYGMDQFLELSDEKSDFEYLSSNFVDLRTDAKELVLKAYDIVELNGEKVAFVGICTPETYTKSTPAYFQDENGNVIYGFSQSSNEEFYEAIQNAVNAAIGEGADRVIAIGHLGIAETKKGWKSTDVIENTTGIDVLLDAHSHEVFKETIHKNKEGKDVLLSSTGTKFGYFGKLTLDDEGVEKTELIVPEEVNINSSEAAKTAYDKVQAKIDEYNKQIEYLYEVIGTTEADLVSEDADGNRIVRKQETNAGDYVTDAYRAVTGADVALCNGGGVRANISAGNVTRKALMDINPWNNAMEVAKVTGRQLLDALEYGARLYPDYHGSFLQVSGLTYEIHEYNESPVIMNEDGTCAGIDASKERRVTNVKVNGENLEEEKEYTVAATEYVFDSHGDGYNMLKDRECVVKESLPVDAEMLIQYLTEHLEGTISKNQYGNTNGDGRIKIIASEDEVYNYLKIAGVPVNKSNADDILGNGTASYDLETNTLTLENANISMTKESKNYPVYAKGDLNIVLKGENKLSSDYFYGIVIVDPANADSINVTISGDGSLESYGSDGGIFVKGSLKIDENVSVTGKCGEDVSGNAYGIRVNNDFEICGNAKVTAKAGSSTGNSYGILAGASIHITGGKVSVENGEAEKAVAIYGCGDINIKDAEVVVTSKGDGIVAPIGSVNISCKKMLTKVTIDTESYGIYAQKGISISDNLLWNGKIVRGQTEEGEQYSYIAAEDGSIAVNLTIMPIENEDTEPPGGTEAPEDEEALENDNNVKTGDQSPVGMLMITCIAAMATIVVVIRKNCINKFSKRQELSGEEYE